MAEPSTPPSSRPPEETPEKAETPAPSPKPSLKNVLTKARRDLWKAQPVWPMGYVLRPIRAFCWDPYLAICSILLPPLIPGWLDTWLSFWCTNVTIPLIHSLYPKVEQAATSSTANNGGGMQSTAKNSLLDATPNRVALAPPSSDLQSAFQGSVSFFVSAIGDVLGAMTNPTKLQGWMKAMAQFNTFMEASGVAAELQESIAKPLWAGRLFTNLKILNDIQEMAFADRAEVCQSCEAAS